MSASPVTRTARRQIAAFVLGCALLLSLPLPALAQQTRAPEVALRSVDGITLQGATAILALSLQIGNPGALALPLHKLRFALQFNGLDVAQGQSTAPVTIPPQQQALLPVQVEVDSPSLLSLIATLPPDGMVRYTLRGTAEIGQTMLQIPFARSGVVRWAASG